MNSPLIIKKIEFEIFKLSKELNLQIQEAYWEILSSIY